MWVDNGVRFGGGTGVQLNMQASNHFSLFLYLFIFESPVVQADLYLLELLILLLLH